MGFTTPEFGASSGKALLAELQFLGPASVPAALTDPADVYLMALRSINQLIASTGEADTGLVFGTEELEGVPEAMAVLAKHVLGTTFSSSTVHSFGDAHWVDFTATLPYGTTEPLVATITCGIYGYPVPDGMFSSAAHHHVTVPAAATDNGDIDMCVSGIRLDCHWRLIRRHAFTEVRRLKFLQMGVDLDANATVHEEDPNWADEPDFQ
jgi:hypothetical protein